MTEQEIYNRFFFLEGLVNENTFRRIADEAIKIHNESSSNAYEESAAWCERLAKLYPENIGFDVGYTMAASRAARNIRAQVWRA